MTTDNKWLALAYLAVRQIPSMLAIAGAVYLAAQGKDGWGWLLFIAVVLN